MRWLLAPIVCLAAFPALAQDPQNCGNPDEVVAQLQEKYGEVPVSGGITGQDGKAAVIVLASPGGKTWTILILADGKACVASAGRSWHSTEGDRNAI